MDPGGSTPSNIHGHYESQPFHSLIRKVQEIAIRASGPKGEVIVLPYTFIATAHA